MATKTKAQLKALFAAGTTPTEDDFAYLIDSNWNIAASEPNQGVNFSTISAQTIHAGGACFVSGDLLVSGSLCVSGDFRAESISAQSIDASAFFVTTGTLSYDLACKGDVVVSGSTSELFRESLSVSGNLSARACSISGKVHATDVLASAVVASALRAQRIAIRVSGMPASAKVGQYAHLAGSEVSALVCYHQKEGSTNRWHRHEDFVMHHWGLSAGNVSANYTTDITVSGDPSSYINWKAIGPGVVAYWGALTFGNAGCSGKSPSILVEMPVSSIGPDVGTGRETISGKLVYTVAAPGHTMQIRDMDNEIDSILVNTNLVIFSGIWAATAGR
jgi:cytoskeletal protein CcmA (bactofilin family)